MGKTDILYQLAL